MINRSDLEKCKTQNFYNCDKGSLVDLRDISIDTSKSVFERMESFIVQVKNPYLFKIGDIVVKVSYGTGKDFFQAFSDAIATS